MVRWAEQDLVPGTAGQHGGKEGVHVARVHGLAVLLDGLGVPQDQPPPQLSILPAKVWSNLAVQPMVKKNELEIVTPTPLAGRPVAHKHVCLR